MDTTTTTNSETLNEAPEVETTEETIADETLEDVNLEEDQDSQDEVVEEETDEIDIDGETFKVPKKLSPLLMMDKDYRQKTQALAEERRQAEATNAERVRTIEMHEKIADDFAQLRHVESRLDYLTRQVDTNALSPEQKHEYTFEMMQLKNAHESVSAAINFKRNEITTNEQRQDAESIRQVVNVLSKPDEQLGWSGGFTDEKSARLTAFGKKAGLTDIEIASIRSPVAIKIMNLALAQYEANNKQRSAIAKPKPVEAKPVTQLNGSKAKSTFNPDKLSADEWRKLRETELRKKRAY